MKSKLIISLLILVTLFSGCTNQNKQIAVSNEIIDKIVPPTEQITNEIIIENHISDFLTKGYSKYYLINNIESKITKLTAENDKLEAIIYTKMNTNNPLKNPDTLPHIQAAKEKAYKESNPDKKHILMQEYITLYSEYLRSSDSNFIFKLAAELNSDKINEDTILLFIEVDADNGVRYEPAERILPIK
jgi:hypothetical protein